MQALSTTGDFMDRALTRLFKMHTGEFGMTAIAFLFGAWIFAPWNPHATSGYASLRALAPVDVWGGISILVSLAFLAARVSHSFKLFRYSAFTSSVWWTFLAIAYGMTNLSSLAVPVFTGLAMMSMFAFLKCSGPLRHER
jgi:hypothetical protein